MTYTPEQTEEIIKLARDALSAGITTDWEAARRAVQAIGDKYGGDGVVLAALGWCDTVLANVPGMGHNKNHAAKMVFLEESSGAVDASGRNVPPGVNWAGRLLLARATDNEEEFTKIVDECETDRQFGGYVMDLLKMSCTNLRPVYQAALQVRASRAREGS